MYLYIHFFCMNNSRRQHSSRQRKHQRGRIGCGIVAYRITNTGTIEYLMIQRKDSIGFINICTGKYSINSKGYIIKLLKHCRIDELELFRNLKIPSMVRNLRLLNKLHNLYSMPWFERTVCGIMHRKKTGQLPKSLGWGFPKGQRHANETDYQCAIREFEEETGYNYDHFKLVHPHRIYDRFIGINGRRYDYRYYIAECEDNALKVPDIDKNKPEQFYEIRNIKWVTYEHIYHKIPRMSQRNFLANIHVIVKAIAGIAIGQKRIKDNQTSDDHLEASVDT